MTEIRCSALLFYLDGVLIDSTPAVARVWRQWAMEHGFEPDEVIGRAHGRPSIATIRDYLPGSNYELENREVERREIADLKGVVVLPGAPRLLDSIPPDRWAIVTSCTRPLAEARLRAAALPIPPLMVTSNDIRSGKPHPEPYLKGAALLGFPAANCIVLEDVPAGIVAGKSAGARVIALETTMAEAELRAAGADWVVKDCSTVALAGLVGTEGGMELQLEI
jgi:mannitol-1-/sugar-/sorbitol-6-phosphatase